MRLTATASSLFLALATGLVSGYSSSTLAGRKRLISLKSRSKA